MWAQILKDVRCGAVFGASPGSGQLARACLENRIVYTGVAENQQLANWLSNILDRLAIALVGQSGTAFYDVDLATLAKAHFQDVADLIGQQDQAADSEAVDDAS